VEWSLGFGHRNEHDRRRVETPAQSKRRLSGFRLAVDRALLSSSQPSIKETNVPRNNLFKIGLATAAAAVGAVLAITSVFAHSAPTTSGHSIVGSLIRAEVVASFPVFTADKAPNTITDEQATDAEEAAELAAAIAAQQAELAAKQAAEAAEKAAEQAAEAAEQQDENTDDQQEGDVENQAGNADQGGD
jgi:hypothetical protein